MFILVHNEPGKAHIETGVPDQSILLVLSSTVKSWRPIDFPSSSTSKCQEREAARGSSQRPVDEANRPAPSAIAHANHRGQEAGSSSGLMGE